MIILIIVNMLSLSKCLILVINFLLIFWLKMVIMGINFNKKKKSKSVEFR